MENKAKDKVVVLDNKIRPIQGRTTAIFTNNWLSTREGPHATHLSNYNYNVKSKISGKNIFWERQDRFIVVLQVS